VPPRISRTDRDLLIVVCAVIAGGVVAATFVVPVFLDFDTCSCPGEVPLGTNFAANDARLSLCTPNATYSRNGCFAGDYVYTLSMWVGGGMMFGNLVFDVTNASGTVVSLFSNGGFSIVNWTGVAQASSTPDPRLAMSGPWNIYAPGVSGSSLLSANQEILIDMGVGNPFGAHLNLTAQGIDGYSGTVTIPLR